MHPLGKLEVHKESLEMSQENTQFRRLRHRWKGNSEIYIGVQQVWSGLTASVYIPVVDFCKDS